MKVIFDSIQVEFREASVRLDVGGVTEELANDYVWIFAGGVAPNDFLKQIGIAFGERVLQAELELAHNGKPASAGTIAGPAPSPQVASSTAIWMRE